MAQVAGRGTHQPFFEIVYGGVGPLCLKHYSHAEPATWQRWPFLSMTTSVRRSFGENGTKEGILAAWSKRRSAPHAETRCRSRPDRLHCADICEIEQGWVKRIKGA
jgi:hypothetical protein